MQIFLTIESPDGSPQEMRREPARLIGASHPTQEFMIVAVRPQGLPGPYIALHMDREMATFLAGMFGRAIGGHRDVTKPNPN